MEITNRFKNAVAALTKKQPVQNSVGVDPNAFLKYGRNRMPSTWTTPEINDEDFYTGYGFAVINKRANRSVVLGKKYLYTEAKEEVIKDANDKGVSVTHPYLDLIRDSIDFAERDFWYDISTYLDLEGVYYLMAVRTVGANGNVGNIQKFGLLNPYWVKQVVNSDGKLGGYVEHNPHLGTREIAKEMIIPIKLLNPFDPNKTYSLADAARDSQFTLKQANDFARESIDGNLNAPGILSSAIELPDDQFDNFVARVKGHNRGEPLFGNGSGTVTYVDMQTDLDKAALDKINSINRDTLLAISGLSKTGVGVEESGTGREVSRTQKDDFTENAIMPQIENIIDALNLDYRKYYSSQYAAKKYSISLDNPLETDRDAEKTDVDIRDSQFTLFQSLIAKGYSIEIASKFAKGLIDITDLGEPTEEVAPVVPAVDGTPNGDGVPPNEPDPTPPADPTNSVKTLFYENAKTDEYEGYPVPVVQYLGDLADQIIPQSETGSTIYSEQAHDKVRIAYIDEFYQHLIGVVDDSTYVLLGEFKNNADRVAIISTLNKRYKNQLVAIKKKINQTAVVHHEDDSVYETIKNTAFDKQTQIDSNTADLKQSAAAAEDKLYRWYVEQINAGNLDPKDPSLDRFINDLTLPFAVYFTVMFPIYAHQRALSTAKQQGVNDIPITAITEEVKDTINTFAKKEADSHMHTIKNDIENALLVIRGQTSDPEMIKQLFAEVYKQIQARRAQAIANNAAARIFNISQYEADLQFLTRAGLLDRAYKVLFNLSGDPCEFCAQLIKQSNAEPIKFTENFADLGSEIHAAGHTLKIDFEPITAGNVHPNCRCAYALIIKEA